MKVNDSKFYHGYLNQLVDEYNNTYHCSIGKTPIDADYFAFTEEIDTNPKAPKFKGVDRVKITKFKNIFSKTPKIGQKKYLLIILCWNLIWMYKTKDLNGETIKSYCKKKLLLSKLWGII